MRMVLLSRRMGAHKGFGTPVRVGSTPRSRVSKQPPRSNARANKRACVRHRRGPSSLVRVRPSRDAERVASAVGGRRTPVPAGSPLASPGWLFPCGERSLQLATDDVRTLRQVGASLTKIRLGSSGDRRTSPCASSPPHERELGRPAGSAGVGGENVSGRA